MGFLSELFGKKKEGPFESYYENGQLQIKGTYKNGVFHRLELSRFSGRVSTRDMYRSPRLGRATLPRVAGGQIVSRQCCADQSAWGA